MEHNKYEEWIKLSVYGELGKAETLELEKHMQFCETCRNEYDVQKGLRALASARGRKEPGDALLLEARQELRAALRKERNRVTFTDRIKGFFMNIGSAPYKLALSGTAVLLIGLLGGYLIFNTDTPVYNVNGSGGTGGFTNISNESLSQQNIQINNVRFIDQDVSDGEVEFTFDAIKPVRMKGKINDPEIQSILMYSMLNEQNPGIRLNSISMLGSKKGAADQEVKAALITVAKFDNNPGVRREAFKMLQEYSFDGDVKDAFLYILMNDSSSAMRIEAINGLTKAGKQGVQFDENELSIFKEKMQADENDYVRFRAKSVIEEYRQ